MPRPSRARKPKGARKGGGGDQAPQAGAAENSEAIAVARESNRITKIAVACSTLVGLLGVGFTACQTLKSAPGPAGPKIEVSAFSAEKLSRIQADVLDLGSPAGEEDVESPVFDAVLKNTGDQTAVVSEIYFKFRHSEKVELCEKGADTIEIAGKYDVKIPFPERPTPFTIHRAVRHKIPAGQTERIVFSIGVGKLPLYSALWLYQVDMFVVTDGADGAVQAGTGLVVTPVPHKGYFLNQKIIDDRNCPVDTLEQVRRFTAMPGAKSVIFEGMLDELTRFAARD